MSVTTDSVEIVWISPAEARRLLGIGPKALQNLIITGVLTERRVVGSKPRLRLDEVEALAAASTRPAKGAAR